MTDLANNAQYGSERVAIEVIDDQDQASPKPIDLRSRALEFWRLALVETVRQESPDLSARQLAILLTVYMTSPPHTVRGLAAQLNISKPAVTRALDRLGQLGYLRRKTDPADRRNVLVQRTVKGSVHLSEFAEVVLFAAGETGIENG